jgi:glyoxylase-like metal-dependent hydrolase (beta-lactamase superfamily II)
MQTASLLGPGLHVLERGWLSSNNVLLDDGDGATLVDSGHCVHAAQTVALLRQRLGARPLRRLINTHLHSDHCGGNAALQREWPLQTLVPAGSWRAMQDWDEQALSYRPTRQRCERFSAQGCIRAGEWLRIGTRDWQVLGAPGHDPESVILFDAEHGVLISADALWESGFGVVFPELEGEAAFDDVQRVLGLIEALPVRCVVPGHGAAFSDVAAALQRARSRLAGFRADPARHLRHGAKVLLKYHLMEERRQPVPALRAWMRDTPLLRSIWAELGHPEGSHAAWSDRLLQDMLDSGVLQRRGDTVHDL